MKKTLLLFFVLSLCTFPIFSQSVEWFESIYRQRDSFSISDAQFHPQSLTASENYIYNIFLSSTPYIDFTRSADTLPIDNLNYLYYQRFVLTQYSTKGELKWKKKLPGTYSSTAAIAQKGDNLFVAATILGKTTFFGDTLNLKDMVVALMKFDKNGNLMWYKFSAPFYYSSECEINKLVVDDDENIYIGGKLFGNRPLVFDKIQTFEWGLQFVFQFDKNGKPIKAHTLFDRERKDGGGIFDFRDMKINHKGEIYILLDDGGRNTESSCAYRPWRASVYKIPKGKAIEQVVSVHSSDLMTVSNMELDAFTDDIYLTGRYRGQMSVNDFKSENLGCGEPNAFLMRLMPNGKVLWFKKGLDGDFSDGYSLVKEPKGSLLWVGIQSYDYNKKDISHRYPNVTERYPDGKTRLFIRRMSPYGKELDSVAYYVSSSYRRDLFSNILIAQNNKNTFLFGKYNCYFDSLSVSRCYQGWSSSEKLFLFKVSDNQLTKEYTFPKNPENDWVADVFPNPTNDYSFLNLIQSTSLPIIVSIYDISGRIVNYQEYPADTKSIFIDCQNYTNGFYLIKAQSGEKIFTTKLIKQ
jgi:Secretion system C-terminal sorting domain